MAIKKENLKLNHIKNYRDGYMEDYDMDLYDWDHEYEPGGHLYDPWDGIDRYWYWEWMDDTNRLREERIDQILGITTDATFSDILPESLKNHK